MGRQWGICSKLWLECDGQPLIGGGRVAMLRSIHRNGSIKQAAQETGISYRRVRGAIQEMENTVGYPLVQTHRGGGSGGGAELTPAAHALVDAFEMLSSGFQKEADARFREMRAFFLPANGKKCHSVKNGEK